MSDIVERLRNRLHDAPMPTEHLLDEAADEIERLRAVLTAERERCAVVAETEPEPEGPMPVEFNREKISDIVCGAVRATRNAIARRIREQNRAGNSAPAQTQRRMPPGTASR